MILNILFFLLYARGVNYITVSLLDNYLLFSGIWTINQSSFTIPYLHRTMDAASGSPLGPHGQCMCRVYRS